MSSLSISPCDDQELTPSTAYTKYSIHRVQHRSKNVCLPFIHMITYWRLNVPSVCGVLPYMIDRHQLALHEGSKIKSPYHIPKVASKLTNAYSLRTWRTVLWFPPSSSPIMFNHNLRVYLQSRSITACKCFSKVARYCLEVHITKQAWSWPPSVTP